MENTKQTTVVENDYPAIVKEIHNEFLTAGDKLLAEAKEQISKANAKKEKINLLREIGFTRTEEYRERFNIEAFKRSEEQKAKIVMYYSKNYPDYKFITKDAVEDICKKYGLVFGQINYFKGFIPKKNAQEVKRFLRKLKTKDIPEKSSAIFDNGMFKWVDNDNCLFGTKKTANPIDFLKICAPFKDFDQSRVRQQGFELVDKDPIVLFETKHGFLVVTAWGTEASDPIVSKS